MYSAKVVCAVFLLIVVVLATSLGGCAVRESAIESSSILWFRPNGYEALFDHGNVHDIEIVISQEAWDAHIQDMKDYAAEDRTGYPMAATYQKATFIYKGPVGDAVIEEVGFRTKGRSSRAFPEDDNGDFHRSHFKIRFNEELDLVEETDEYELRNNRRFCTLRSLNLRVNTSSRRDTGSTPDFFWDPTQMTRVFCYDLATRAGVYTSRTGFARLTVTIDGQPVYFGIYDLIEPIDKSFLTRRYGKSRNDGNLYKCAATPNSGPATLEPIPDQIPFPEPRLIGVKDPDAHYRPTYDLKTNTDQPDHTELLDFIEKLDTLEGDALKEYLDDNFEVDRFLRHLVLSVLMGKWDDYWTMGNNYYLYFNNGGKIEFIPCDYDIVLGQGFNMFYTPSTGIYDLSNQFHRLINLWIGTPGDDVPVPNFGAPLSEKILQIDEYQVRYEQYFREFITPSNGLFVYSQFEEQFRSLYRLLSPHLDNDTNESEEMVNDAGIAAYFYERTRAVVDELGLDAQDYETKPHSLTAPAGLRATAGESTSEITVTWDAVPLAEYYEVYRSDSPGGDFELVGQNLNATAFSDEGIAPKTTYYYRIVAMRGDGLQSEFSIEVAGSTREVFISTPVGVSATDGMYTDMINIWWSPIEDAAHYRVYRADSLDGAYDQIGGDTPGTVFYDESVAANATYYYRVKSFGEDSSESEFSTQATGSASDLGSSGPEMLKGAALASGTYSLDTGMGTMTYVFNDDGTVTRLVPDPSGMLGSDIVYEGEWGYDGTEVTFEATASLLGGAMILQEKDIYRDAFTIDDGSKLVLMGLRQVSADEDGTIQRFLGSQAITLIMEGLGMDGETFYPISTEVIVNDDGTMDVTYKEMAYTTQIPGRQIRSETLPVDSTVPLIEFGGFYYRYPLNESDMLVRE